jgi:hypothetical protein
VATLCVDHGTTLYPKKFALTSPASGRRSVGIVRLQTKRHGVCFCGFYVYKHLPLLMK